MPSPLRRPSRSVRVPGRVSRPVRLGYQSPGSFFAPYQERLPTGESPQGPHGPAVPPRTPAGGGTDDAATAVTATADAGTADAGSADSGTADSGAADEAKAEVSPAEVSPAEVSPSEVSRAALGR